LKYEVELEVGGKLIAFYSFSPKKMEDPFKTKDRKLKMEDSLIVVIILQLTTIFATGEVLS